MERATITQTDVLDIDRDEFGRAFARHSILVHHSLSDHPLLSIEAIADLADRLPPRSVRREAGTWRSEHQRG